MLMRVFAVSAIFLALIYSLNVLGFLNFYKPCSKPIAYNIGTMDERFGLSHSSFLEVIREAEAIWEKPSGKDLFAHSDKDSDLAINLIYDYRQKTTETLAIIEGTVEGNKVLYDNLHRQFVELKSNYESAKASYEEDVRAFNQKNAQYEEMVASWNSGPRNSKAQFKALEDKRLELESEARQIRAAESNLNEMASEINTVVDKLNRLAKSLNLNVEQFNTIGASRGETFTGGLYVSDRDGERIDIFEFENREKLKRVLAHELGHALGLDHVDDERAIMYHLNEGDVGVLTQSDLEALKTLCGTD